MDKRKRLQEKIKLSMKETELWLELMKRRGQLETVSHQPGSVRSMPTVLLMAKLSDVQEELKKR